MKVLYNWLVEFSAVNASAKELAERCALHGLPVESLENSPAGPLIDFEIFSNRGDLLGHYGIAREVAALCRVPLKRIQPVLKESAARAEAATRVDIQCPELCARFTARVIRGVKVQPSPDWLRQRLEALGQASINNVVDATNYVMLELGHPLHAFDMEKLAEQRIVVRAARAGEKFRTLDGVERTLQAGMCMVCDAARAVGIGGVMGGAEMEISFSTRSVLLECAWFDPISIRRTSKALGLRTEASQRFERGADPELAELASRRCADLIQKLAGGEVLAGVVDAYARRAEVKKIELTRKELLRVMGADVPDGEIESILSALGFAPQRLDTLRGAPNSLMAAWECKRPAWRGDVGGEIDLIEEVARHYGFEKFPARLAGTRLPAARLPYSEAEDFLRERLAALGYHEIITIPMTDPEDEAVFRPEGLKPAELGNPLAADASVLRSSGLTGMLRALEWNINRGQHDVRLFEIGRRYELQDRQPRETRILTLGATGLSREKSVHEDLRDYSFADLKGELEALGELCGGFAWQDGGPAWLHPARAARVAGNGVALGVAGQLARRVAEQFKLRQDAFVAELLLDPICAACEHARGARRFAAIPRFPAVERDFSLVLGDAVTFEQVREAIRGLRIPELTRVQAVDYFRGGQIPPGKHSLLVRVTFQSSEATLTEAQLSDFTVRIVGALEKSVGATLRT